MKVQEIMTESPVCCTPDSTLQQVAQMMATHDCGEIPVVESSKNKRLVGVVTDRDICCRAVAKGKDISRTHVSEYMSSPVVTVMASSSIDECCDLMEQYQIRRVPVVDKTGACCGIVTQADIAESASDSKIAEVVQRVSEPASSHYPA